MRLVKVEWIDAHGGGRYGWRPLEGMTERPAPCRSVGYLLRETGEEIVVVPHLQDTDMGDGEIIIPGRWVKRIVDLKEARDD